jgi:hypothetical protein
VSRGCRRGRDETYDQCQVLGMEEMAESCLFGVMAALAYDLTLLDPPSHVHEVDHTKVPLVSESTVVHCDPDVAAASSHRSW